MIFLLRAWEWPASDHLIFLGFLGILQGIGAYCGAQAYRLAQARMWRRLNMRRCHWQFSGVGLCSATFPTNGR